eukprot:g2440.t1
MPYEDDRDIQGNGDRTFVAKHWSVLLLVDISGFTRLSQTLGAEKTKLHCNAYFSRLLRVVRSFRGDTFKFLGDAMLVMWVLEPNSSEDRRTSTCKVASECAAAIMSVGEYDATDTCELTGKPHNVSLRLHCGLACGMIYYFRVGYPKRYEDLVGGKCFEQLKACLDGSKTGEVIASRAFFETFRLGNEEVHRFRRRDDDHHELIWIRSSRVHGSGERSRGMKEIAANHTAGLRRRASKLTASLSKRAMSFYSQKRRIMPILSTQSERDEESIRRRAATSEDDIVKDVAGIEYTSKSTTGEVKNSTTLTTAKERVKNLLPSCSICCVAIENQEDAYAKYLEHFKRMSSGDRDGMVSVVTERSTGEKTDDSSHLSRDLVDFARRKRHRILGALQKEFRLGRPRTSSSKRRQETRALISEVTREAIDNDMAHLMGTMTRVTTMFVSLDALLTELDRGSLESVQNVFLAVQNALSEEGGVLRQFVRDDKGFVAIGVFGAHHAKSFVDNASRALRAAFTILERIEDETNAKCSAGVATGHAFCGLVGAEHRCEWAVMGPSVNLAARLMGKASPGVILLDGETFGQCKLESTDFDFEKLQPVSAKGYSDPVPVYHPSRSSGASPSDKIGDDDPSLFEDKAKVDALPRHLVSRMATLTIFEKLLLRTAAVASFQTRSKQGSEYADSGQERTAQSFSLSTLTMAMTMLGYGHDVHKIQVSLEKLTEEPPLVSLSTSHGPFEKSTSDDIAKMWAIPKSVQEASKSTGMYMKGSALVLVTRVLSSHYLFRRMTKAQLTGIAMAMRPMRVACGDAVFKQGDITDGYFVIQSGTVSVVIDGHAVKTLGHGKSFGELALLYNMPRSASIVVVESLDCPAQPTIVANTSSRPSAPSQLTVTKSFSFANPRIKTNHVIADFTPSKAKQSDRKNECKLWVLDRNTFLKHVKQDYVFTHKGIQDSIYATMLTKQRQKLHGIIASASNNSTSIDTALLHIIRSDLKSPKKITLLERFVERASAKTKTTRGNGSCLKALSLLLFYSVCGFDAPQIAAEDALDTVLDRFLRRPCSKAVQRRLQRLQAKDREKVETNRDNTSKKISFDCVSIESANAQPSYPNSPLSTLHLDRSSFEPLHLAETFEDACEIINNALSKSSSDMMEPFDIMMSTLLKLGAAYLHAGQDVLAFNVSMLVTIYLGVPTPSLNVLINSSSSWSRHVQSVCICISANAVTELRRGLSVMSPNLISRAIDAYSLIIRAANLRVSTFAENEKDCFSEYARTCESFRQICLEELDLRTNHSPGSHCGVESLVSFSAKQISFDTVTDWTRFDIFEFAASCEAGDLFPQLFFTLYGSGGFDCVDKLNISKDSLTTCLRHAQSSYENPFQAGSFNFYHNALHGADVMCSSTSLVMQLDLKWLSDEAFSPLMKFALGISALFHDYRHPGVNANFLKASGHPLVAKYPSGTLEHMHAAEALLLLGKFGILDAFVDRSERVHFRHTVASLILSTDFSRGLETVQRVHKISARVVKRSKSTFKRNKTTVMNVSHEEDVKSKMSARENISTVLGLALECADLAHPAKPLRIHQRWSVMVTQEFYHQGKQETSLGLPLSPMCKPQDKEGKKAFKWSRGQQCFIQYLVQPKFEAFTRLCDPSKNTWTGELVGNTAFWGSRSMLCHFENLSADVGRDSAFACAIERARSAFRENSTFPVYRPKMTM